MRAAMYLLGFSATPMLTACYGLPTNYNEPFDFDPFEDISGTVLDRHSDKPIPGIKVSIDGKEEINAITDSEGKFHINYTFDHSEVISVEDIDGKENGYYWNQIEQVTDENNIGLTIYMLPEDK